MWEQQGVPVRFPAVQQKRASLTPLETETPYTRRKQQQEYASAYRVGTSVGIHDESMPDGYIPAATTQRITRAKPVPLTEDDDIDIAYADKHTRLPNSARRYHRDTEETLPALVTVKEVTQKPTLISFQHFVVACVGVLVSAMLCAALWIIAIAPALTNWSDTNTYGYPRIFRTEANVGHYSTASRFLGINNGGIIEVLEYPKDSEPKDSNTGQPKMYVVTHVVGPNSDLIPVSSISFVDVQHNGKPEMLVVVQNVQYQFNNTGNGFTERQ